MFSVIVTYFIFPVVLETASRTELVAGCRFPIKMGLFVADFADPLSFSVIGVISLVGDLLRFERTLEASLIA